MTGETPVFYAADVVAAWLITGETRGYNAPGGYFDAVSPDRTVFEGGPGAWEAVLHLSYIDLDSGTFHGGKLWRLTPMVNWHLSDNIRFELGYGYAVLDRFDLKRRHPVLPGPHTTDALRASPLLSLGDAGVGVMGRSPRLLPSLRLSRRSATVATKSPVGATLPTGRGLAHAGQATHTGQGDLRRGLSRAAVAAVRVPGPQVRRG